MKILALTYFDPASVVLSHRDLMRAAGHDFRLATVRAYTEHQRQADYVVSEMNVIDTPVGLNTTRRSAQWTSVNYNREELISFAREADVIQFHPGIGHGDGDWATQGRWVMDPMQEFDDVCRELGMDDKRGLNGKTVAYIHGSNATARHRNTYRGCLIPFPLATSTLDYAHELDATYLPPLVNVGDRRALLRGDDDPLVVAHTPTDHTACSTDAFVRACTNLGILYKLGEGLPHSAALDLKATCNIGFDHLRGAFSANTLENAAIGLVPLFGLRREYQDRALREGFDLLDLLPCAGITTMQDVARVLCALDSEPALTRERQRHARTWWTQNFNAAAITARLIRFYESL